VLTETSPEKHIDPTFRTSGRNTSLLFWKTQGCVLVPLIEL